MLEGTKLQVGNGGLFSVSVYSETRLNFRTTTTPGTVGRELMNAVLKRAHSLTDVTGDTCDSR